jgi:nucleoside-diphosphate-sugar epimerase
MKVRCTELVTGGTGFIGAVLVDTLLREGARIRLLTRGQQDLPKRWIGRVEVREGDLARLLSLAGVAEGIERVYHLAGEVRRPELFDLVNRQATQQLVEVCEAAGVQRFLYLSSTGIIGATGAASIVDERTPASPRNAYELSKCLGERAVLTANNPAGMSTTALRPSIVYGEGRLREGDGFLRWVRAIQRGRAGLLGKRYISSYVYVGDVVAACIALSRHPGSSGQAYIINEPIALAAFVDEIAGLLHVRKPPVMPTPLGSVGVQILRFSGRSASLYNRTTYSAEKLLNLGFAFPYGYRNGLRRTIEWYQDNGLLVRG